VKQDECGASGYTGSNYCSSGDVYRNYVTRGCSGDNCTESTGSVKQDECGASGYTGSNYCSSGDVYRDYVTRGCSGDSCSESTAPVKQEECGTCSCSAGTCSVCPVTISPPTQDTFISMGSSTTSFGNEITMLAGDTAGGDIYRALVRFDVSELDDKTILDAQLCLRWSLLLPGSATGIFLNVARIRDPWSESATWSNDFDLRFADIGNHLFRESDNPVCVDVTDITQTWANGTDNYGFALFPQNQVEVYASFYTSESANDPELRVQYAD